MPHRTHAPGGLCIVCDKLGDNQCKRCGVFLCADHNVDKNDRCPECEEEFRLVVLDQVSKRIVGREHSKLRAFTYSVLFVLGLAFAAGVSLAGGVPSLAFWIGGAITGVAGAYAFGKGFFADTLERMSGADTATLPKSQYKRLRKTFLAENKPKLLPPPGTCGPFRGVGSDALPPNP